MSPEDIRLSKISQSQKDIYFMVLFTQGTKTEKRMVGGRAEEGGVNGYSFSLGR
jgi:hypothetical protein